MTTWLEHVKKTHAAGSTSFKESLKRASASWKKTKGASKSSETAAPKKRRRKKKAAVAEVEEKTSTEAQEAPKKKRRRRVKKNTPVLPDKNLKNIDSRNLR